MGKVGQFEASAIIYSTTASSGSKNPIRVFYKQINFSQQRHGFHNNH